MTAEGPRPEGVLNVDEDVVGETYASPQLRP